jgi:hypothetical protein
MTIYLRITVDGIPKEISMGEKRVSLTDGMQMLVVVME